MKNKKLLAIVEGAMMLAMAYALDLVCSLLPFNAVLFPYGGSISIGMAPIVYYSFRHGAGYGIGAGFIFSLIQMLMGFYVPPANTFIAVVLCVLLDYVIAFSVIGSANIIARNFKEKRLVGYGISAFAVCVLRYICSTLSGGILWGSYAPAGMNPWIYAITYNATYMLPNALLTAVVIVMICKALDPKNLKKMK